MPEALSLCRSDLITSGPILGELNRSAGALAAAIGRLNLASNLAYSAKSGP